MSRLLFLDTETTGLGNCRMVSLAWSKDGVKIEKIMAKPPIPIEVEASMVNHITNRMVADLPAFRELGLGYEKTKELIESSIVVAHNAKFDIDVLAREGIFVREYIDTKEVAQAHFPELKMHRLQYLRYALDLDVEGDAHTAAGDVNVLIALWKRMAGTTEASLIAQFKRTVSSSGSAVASASLRQAQVPSRGRREQIRAARKAARST